MADEDGPSVVAEKDRPLLLRRKADGKLYLDLRVCDSFPPRHEFSQDWLLENTAGGVVNMDQENIRLSLANGWAIYHIDRTMMEEVRVAEDEETAEVRGVGVGDSYVARLSTGYWGILEDSEVVSG